MNIQLYKIINEEKNKMNQIKSSIYNIIISQRNKIIYKISPVLLSKILFKETFKESLNLKNPKTFNEKIMWLKLYYYRNNKKVKDCIDKYKVREYIEKKELKEILVKLYGVYNDSNEIDFEKLPKSFVLKSTSGSGNNLIIENKDEININEVKMTIDKWKKEEYEKKYGEVQYEGIEKRIICEEYLGDNITDYKFFCFNGEPRFLYISTGLGKKENLCMEYLDMKFNSLNIKRKGYNNFTNLQKPSNFEILVDYSKKLSKDFPFVRVDLYDIDNKIYFSELTFVPTAGLMRINPEKYDLIWGEYLDINKLITRNKKK